MNCKALEKAIEDCMNFDEILSRNQNHWFTLRVLLVAVITCALTLEGRAAQREGLELLTHNELVLLPQQNDSASPLRDKLMRLLNPLRG
jgi:hypothetical protein